jgi:hypothetical protein
MASDILIFVLPLVLVDFIFFRNEFPFEGNLEPLLNAAMDIVIIVLLVECELLEEIFHQRSQNILALRATHKFFHEKLLVMIQIMVFVADQPLQQIHLLPLPNARLRCRDLVSKLLPLIDAHFGNLGFNFLDFSLSSFEVFFIFFALATAELLGAILGSISLTIFR